jgi:hypothetical protein
MKTRRAILLSVAGILLFLNLVVLMASPKIPPEYNGDPAFAFGWYTGKLLLALIAFYLLIEAGRVNKKIKAKHREELMNAFKDLPGRDPS